MKPMAKIDLDNIEAMARREGFAHYKDTLLLIEEIKRLKEGRFTEEEFQNLCHNFDTSDVCRFRKGCREYQDKLFGREAVDAAVIKELRDSLELLKKEIRQS